MGKQPMSSSQLQRPSSIECLSLYDPRITDNKADGHHSSAKADSCRPVKQGEMKTEEKGKRRKKCADFIV